MAADGAGKEKAARFADTIEIGLFTARPGIGEFAAKDVLYKRRHPVRSGKQVIAEAEQRIQDIWGCNEMVMTVINLRTELIAWYERRGYQQTGATMRPPFDLRQELVEHLAHAARSASGAGRAPVMKATASDMV